MRNWIILIEVSFAIIFLTIFYLIARYYFISIMSENIYLSKINVDDIRKLNSSCELFPEYKYSIYNFSDTIYCEYGKYLNEMKGSVVYQYLFSGKDEYKPYIILIYR